MNGEIVVIGDVHGELDALERMIDITSRCTLRVFVGDYVNRGPNSRGVIDRLIALKAHTPTRLLAGNHDEAFLSCLREGRLREFLVIGGAGTIRSYVSRPRSDLLEQLRQVVPPSHLQFLEDLEVSYEADGLRVVHDHAGEHSPDQFVVAGHQVQHSLAPEIGDGFACIDTGCGSRADGLLCGLLWPSRAWALVDREGVVVRDFSIY